MESPSALWSIVTIGGPILLALALLWALLRNRAQRGDVERTEQATREVYRQENEAHADEEDRSP